MRNELHRHDARRPGWAKNATGVGEVRKRTPEASCWLCLVIIVVRVAISLCGVEVGSETR